MEEALVLENKVMDNYYLKIDCPPGLVKPDTILSTILLNTDLTINDFKNTSCCFGEWTFNIYENKIDLFKLHFDEIVTKLKKSYASGQIRYAEFNCPE